MQFYCRQKLCTLLLSKFKRKKEWSQHQHPFKLFGTFLDTFFWNLLDYSSIIWLTAVIVWTLYIVSVLECYVNNPGWVLFTNSLFPKTVYNKFLCTKTKLKKTKAEVCTCPDSESRTHLDCWTQKQASLRRGQAVKGPWRRRRFIYSFCSLELLLISMTSA